MGERKDRKYDIGVVEFFQSCIENFLSASSVVSEITSQMHLDLLVTKRQPYPKVICGSLSLMFCNDVLQSLVVGELNSLSFWIR